MISCHFSSANGRKNLDLIAEKGAVFSELYPCGFTYHLVSNSYVFIAKGVLEVVEEC